jgi:chemotaxis protein MotC
VTRGALLSLMLAAVAMFAAADGAFSAGDHHAPAADAPKDAEADKAHGEKADKGHGEKAEKDGEAEGEAAAEPEVPLWSEVPAVELEKQPYVLVRALRAIQDEIAGGSLEAHERQRRVMRDMSQQMRALPTVVWDDVRNVRAAIFFVLSGGDPSVLKLVIGREKTPHIERRLVKGALAYGEGRLVDALALMQKMEGRQLDPSLGGMVALIQGTLTAKKDTQKALVYFNEARLLAPGTLVEESALRQQIMILARDGEVEKFDLLASQYSRRFPRSLFARNFRQQFFAGVARQGFKRASEWISRTETELKKVPVSERAGLYLAIAEEALKVGNIGMAQFAAGKARELSTAGSRTLQRATLYEGAAMVATADFEKGQALLASIDVPKLGMSDRQVLESARSVARAVGRWPETSAAPNEPATEAVGRAETLLSQVDSLLEGASQ